MLPRRLFHHPFSPFCRKVRLVLAEKRQPFDAVLENPWERRPDFLAMAAEGDVPLLVEPDGSIIANATAIAEYLEETVPEPPLVGQTIPARAEVRRLVGWFDGKFYAEVSNNLLRERLWKFVQASGSPLTALVRAGLANIHYHLEYIGWLAERRTWLAGDHFSLADITAAAHLSALDYLGLVPWEQYAEAKEWYARIKSRPSFRPLLEDSLTGLPAAPHYADLDF